MNEDQKPAPALPAGTPVTMGAPPGKPGSAPIPPPRPLDEEPDEESLVEVRAQLDIPGETGRQARVFAVWIFSLALAVVLSSAVGAHLSLDEAGSIRAERELARSRGAKARVALVVGLLLPALLTFGLNRRYRRGGGHARGITLDVTKGGEIRIWGRGYGSRVRLEGAFLTERLVDVYAGRLGAWRQRRLRVRAASPRAGSREIEIATTARRADMEEGLAVEGGEGDCVEFDRDDFDRVRDCVLSSTKK